ncbi:MAG: carbohydrate ABC transporter permease, partial [Clostridiaceae bacterium]|nr:carbohydrate ABC transporter permease [Clostridiaceae bacterium]
MNYVKIFKDVLTLNAFKNSILVSSGAAIIDVILAALAAYGFSRFKFRGYKEFKLSILIIRLYPGMILAITLFQLAGKLNIYDTLIPL